MYEIGKFASEIINPSSKLIKKKKTLIHFLFFFFSFLSNYTKTYQPLKSKKNKKTKIKKKKVNFITLKGHYVKKILFNHF